LNRIPIASRKNKTFHVQQCTIRVAESRPFRPPIISASPRARSQALSPGRCLDMRWTSEAEPGAQRLPMRKVRREHASRPRVLRFPAQHLPLTHSRDRNVNSDMQSLCTLPRMVRSRLVNVCSCCNATSTMIRRRAGGCPNDACNTTRLSSDLFGAENAARALRRERVCLLLFVTLFQEPALRCGISRTKTGYAEGMLVIAMCDPD
jgi:hypothetical protein